MLSIFFITSSLLANPSFRVERADVAARRLLRDPDRIRDLPVVLRFDEQLEDVPFRRVSENSLFRNSSRRRAGAHVEDEGPRDRGIDLEYPSATARSEAMSSSGGLSFKR